eukprot:GAFH01003510.1.p1 GENE.GAFH01003510.1~~GAFH01003510.1.p1  ORF type:complete len:251 (-),score=57.67 GAFH01003510.1:9-761(-)
MTFEQYSLLSHSDLHSMSSWQAEHQISASDWQETRQRRSQLYREASRDPAQVSLKPGVEPLLSQLVARQAPVYVSTRSTRAEVDGLCGVLPLLGRAVTRWVTRADCPAQKPSPACWELCLAHFFERQPPPRSPAATPTPAPSPARSVGKRSPLPQSGPVGVFSSDPEAPSARGDPVRAVGFEDTPEGIESLLALDVHKVRRKYGARLGLRSVLVSPVEYPELRGLAGFDTIPDLTAAHFPDPAAMGPGKQ